MPYRPSARRRRLPRMRHPQQVSTETDAPGENRVDDHPLHPAAPETEEVIRNEQAEGSERTDPEQDRHIGKRRAKDPEREDGGQAREEERDERDDRVEEAEGLREDADPDGSDSREEDQDHEDWVLECPEEEPRRREDRDAEQNDRRVEYRGASTDPEVADVVRRDAVTRVHRFGDDQADRELRGPGEEEQTRPLSVLEAHARGETVSGPKSFRGSRDVSPDLLLVDLLDRLVEPRAGLAILRRKVFRVCDEGQAFESTDDPGRQLPMHIAHAEVVVPRAVPHSEGSDEGWDDKGSIELEGLERVASQKLLLDKGSEQLDPFAKTPAMVVDAANERLAIEWGAFDRVALVEEEDDLAMDFSHEELVRRGDGQHREVDEEELAGLLESVEFLEDPGAGGPGLFVDESDR